MLTDDRQIISSELLTSNIPAIIHSGKIITYRHLAATVDAFAKQLKSDGIKQGTRVAIVNSNSAEYIIVLLSLWSIKAVACPISTHLPQEAVSQRLQQINARHLDLSKFIIPRDLLSGESVSMNLTYHPDQDATIVHTTGSNGTPKPVLHTFENHISNALSSNQVIQLEPGDKWLLSLPLYHVGGLGILFRCLMSGATIVLPKNQKPLKEIIEGGIITHISCVATQLLRLLDDEQCCFHLKNLKAILVGGSAIPEPLLQKAIKLNLSLFITYGLTEMASQVATAKFPQSAKILNYGQVKIDADEEILVKGKKLFKGYVERNHIDRPLDTNGWFHTGDIGSLTEEGSLIIKGRKDNMFISGGENIQPEEIEGLLCKLDSIEQAAILPVTHNEFGFRPIAMVKVQKGGSINREELVDFLRDHLPKFKIPDHFYNWPNETDSEKIKVNRQYLLKHICDQNTSLQEIN